MIHTLENLPITRDYRQFKDEVCDQCRRPYSTSPFIIDEGDRLMPPEYIPVCDHCDQESYPDEETLEEFESRFYN